MEKVEQERRVSLSGTMIREALEVLSLLIFEISDEQGGRIRRRKFLSGFAGGAESKVR